MKGISFDKLRSTLGALPRAIGRLMDETAGPNEGSRAAEEFGKAGELVKAAHVQAELAIIVAADHMAALERQLTEPVMTFAPWTTDRGILEASSTAMWLLADVDLKKRVERSINLRLRHLEDQEIYVRDALKRHQDVPSFVEALPHIKARVQHLIEQAATLDIPQKRDRRGRLIGFGEGLPTATELADSQLDAGGTFRLLSAVAHGRTWANLALGLRRFVSEGTPKVEQQLTVDAARFLILSALDWFARPTWADFKLNGWDLKRLATILEGIYDQAALVEKTRFWRTESGGPGTDD